MTSAHCSKCGVSDTREYWERTEPRTIVPCLDGTESHNFVMIDEPETEIFIDEDYEVYEKDQLANEVED